MTSPPTESSHREQRFRTLYEAAYGDLLRFVRRRVEPARAEDVVADVMLVVWRRLDDVPADLSDARAWMFGVARKQLLNAARGDVRERNLEIRLADRAALSSPDDDRCATSIATKADLAAAWPGLSSLHQEAITLAVLDELSAAEAAHVLGISPTAYRLRLSRARKSLRRLIDAPHGASGAEALTNVRSS